MLTLDELRAALEDMTKRFTGLAIGHQVQVVETLRRHYQHRIRVVSLADPSNLKTWRFNCHAFTFGLWQQELFWHLQDSHPDAWPDGGFVTNRLRPAMRRVYDTELQAGNIALYFDSDRLTHSGIVRANVICSKWGDGHVWDHGALEVPKSYGARTEYYNAPPDDCALNAYLIGAGFAVEGP